MITLGGIKDINFFTFYPIYIYWGAIKEINFFTFYPIYIYWGGIKDINFISFIAIQLVLVNNTTDDSDIPTTDQQRVNVYKSLFQYL